MKFFFFFRHRIPEQKWWLKLRSLLRMLAQHDALYEKESDGKSASIEEIAGF